MGNKKKCIGLSIFLLVLLLGLSTTSYASNFSETDFKNIIANAFTGFGTRENSDTIINNVFNNSSFVNNLLTLQDTYDYLYIDAYGSPTNRIDFYFGNDNTYHCYYNSGNKYYYFKSNGRYTLSINNSTLAFNTPYTNISSSVSINNVQYLKYSDRDFFTASSGGSIYKLAGWFDRDFSEDIYFSNATLWHFEPTDIYSGTINVQGLSQNFVRLDTTAVSSKFLGQLFKSENCGGIWRDFYIYDTYNKSWKYLNDNVVYLKKMGWIGDYFNTTYTTDSAISDIYIKGNLCVANTYFRYQFIPDSEDISDYLDVWFYVTDNNTKFVNGAISPDTTFSGDYIGEYNKNTNQFNNDLNTDIDNSNREQGISDILNTDYSGDYAIHDIVGSFDVADPTDNIFSFVLNGITNVLIGSYSPATLTVPLPYLNQTIYVRSDFYILPTVFRTFVSAGIIYITAKHYFSKIRSIIHVLSSGDIVGFGKIALVGLNIDDLL